MSIAMDTGMVGDLTFRWPSGVGVPRRNWRRFARKAWTFSRSRSTAARSRRHSGARLGAITWSRSATTPIACRAAEPMSATARFAICVSPKETSRHVSRDRSCIRSTFRSQPLPPAKWRAIKQQSAGKIGSLLELLQGKLSDEVMRIVTDQKEGLFPLPQEISFRCDCPDWAGMCKHIAAVMYGVGARLDVTPRVVVHASRRGP